MAVRHMDNVTAQPIRNARDPQCVNFYLLLHSGSTRKFFVATLPLYLQRVSATQQQQPCTRKRKHRLPRLADMVHLQLSTMTSCGCLLALMVATANMAMAGMS